MDVIHSIGYLLLFYKMKRIVFFAVCPDLILVTAFY